MLTGAKEKDSINGFPCPPVSLAHSNYYTPTSILPSKQNHPNPFRRKTGEDGVRKGAKGTTKMKLYRDHTGTLARS